MAHRCRDYSSAATCSVFSGTCGQRGSQASVAGVARLTLEGSGPGIPGLEPLRPGQRRRETERRREKDQTHKTRPER